jgi:trehalose-phosphatase
MRTETSMNPGAASPVHAVVHALEKQVEKSDRILLALDRDGTLIPLAHRPEEAKPDPELIELLDSLCRQPQLTVAVVSARSKAQLHADFPGLNLIYAGNYGMEIDFPQGETIIQQEALDAVPRLKWIRNELASLTADGIGAILEDHGYSLCLHWQTVPAEERSIVHETVSRLSAQYGNLIFKALTTSYEVQPNFQWDKGKALAQIVSVIDESAQGLKPQQIGRDGFDGKKLGAFVYFGDSQPDEPAFQFVNEHQGVSVKIGAASAGTSSIFQLPDTQAAREALKSLLDSLRKNA